MGTQKFQEFKKMIAALERCDYDTAASELLDSKYHEQVGARAEQLATIILKGVLQ
jgi:lysozyme